MDEKEKQKRLGVISTLFGAFGQSSDVNRIKIYLRATSEVPVKLLEKACMKILIECKFLPTISEIVEASRALVGEMDENKRVKTWDEAWAEIEKAMYATPWGKIPSFSTPEITKAVNSFGWNALQETLMTDMPTVRAQIRRMYDDICKRSKEQGNNDYVLHGKKESLIQARKSDDFSLVVGTLAKQMSL